MSVRYFKSEASRQEKQLLNVFDEAWSDWETNYRPMEDKAIARSGLTDAARATGMGVMTAEARQKAGQVQAQQQAQMIAGGYNPGSGAFAAGQQGMVSTGATALGSAQTAGSLSADNEAYSDMVGIAGTGVTEGGQGVRGMGMSARYQNAADNLTQSMYQNRHGTQARMRADNLSALGTGIGTAFGIGLQKGGDLFGKGISDKDVVSALGKGDSSQWVGGDAYTGPSLFDKAEMYS